ncbi:MAG: hypothetical protein KF746_21295 [Chitinophagaceae bacterium]|nr:hypothetical protein [Chitinophagaceae bacterium]
MELKIIPEKNGCRYLLCDAHGNYFELSKIAYDMLATYQQTNNYDSVLSTLRVNYPGICITQAAIEKNIKYIMSGISKDTKSSYIFKVFTIVKSGKGVSLYKALKILFQPVIFLIMLATALVISIGYYSRIQHISSFGKISVGHMPVYYALFLLILFCHELGHATAAFNYGVRPKDIGFGLYFIFPVFFTNVTNIWELNTLKRIIVNIGGIYFQMLINLLLITLTWFGLSPAIVQKLFIINSISIIICLVPFLRYDGYWIISDICRIPNLKKKASALVVCLIAKPIQIKKYFLQNKISVTLTIYAALYAAFWASLYLYLGHFIITSVTSISQDLLLDNPYKATFVVERFLVLMFISITITLAFCRFIKSICCYAKTK